MWNPKGFLLYSVAATKIYFYFSFVDSKIWSYISKCSKNKPRLVRSLSSFIDLITRIEAFISSKRDAGTFRARYWTIATNTSCMSDSKHGRPLYLPKKVSGTNLQYTKNVQEVQVATVFFLFVKTCRSC